jgi:iron complex transport system ATP-binding protein
MGELLLEASGVDVEIAGRTIVADAGIAVAPGRLVAIVGPNGAGKSTLVRALAGIQPLAAGSVRWGGEDVASLRGRRLALLRAFVPQRALVPGGVTVREAVAIGRSPHVGMLARPTKADAAAVDRALARAHVAGFADRMLPTLSGGELQRVQIAVALAQEAPMLIADEPTSHLDLGAAVELTRLLRRLADDGLGVLLVVHDLALAAAAADVVVVMSEGAIVATGPPQEALTEERLAAVWGVEAEIHRDADGRTALRVGWLDPATS